MKAGDRVKTVKSEQWWMGFTVPAGATGTVVTITKLDFVIVRFDQSFLTPTGNAWKELPYEPLFIEGRLCAID